LSTDPLLVRTRGAEVGVRTKAVQGLDSSVSVFILDQASELVFDGDTGTTSAGRPSERTGIEFTNDYRPTSWAHIDANLALSRARFLGYDSDQAAIYQSLTGYPAAQIGNAPGNYIYNAPSIIASAGVTLGDKLGWFGALRWRYIGAPDRGRRLQVTAVQHLQCPAGLPVRERVARSARRPEPLQFQYRPGELRLRIAAQVRSPLRPVQCRDPAAVSKSGCGMHERHHGPCAAPGRAVCGSGDRGGEVLMRSVRPAGSRDRRAGRLICRDVAVATKWDKAAVRQHGALARTNSASVAAQ
jgi:hypothetical protein